MDKTKNAETSKKILDAALALWNEKGYSQTTMRELARRLGMGVSSLYFYFRSKEEIVQFLYAEVNEKARARFLERSPREGDLGPSFKSYVEIKLELLLPQRSCLAAILKEAIDPESSLSPVSRESSRVLSESIGFFRELVGRSSAAQRGQEGGLASLLWLAHVSVLLYWLHDRSAGFANTKRLLEKLAAGMEHLPMVGALPGAGEIFTLLADVLEPGTNEEPRPATRSEDDPGRTREADVVVLGAGPIGIVFASFLKLRRPKTSILVLDRQAEPGHKIGESTLSGFCKALRSIGIRADVMQRLFYPKNGLGFLHVTEATKDFTTAPEYVLESFDQTFQVERRVLDGLLIANAERLGIQVVHGAQVSLPKSQLGTAGNVIVYDVGPSTFRVRTPLLVDASGPAGVVSRALGARSDEDVAFQTSSVWTYFSGIKPLASYQGWPGRSQAPRDHYTQHLCFKEGWLWYIPIVSWQAAPTANLSKIFDRVLQSARGVPTRDELEGAYASPAQDIVSVGLSLRSDRDPRIAEDPRGAFEHYVRKYPAIRQLLHGAKNLEDHYGPATTFMSRGNYRGHAKEVTGDGWLLVGDAAFFVDPLISPGLTGGTASAFQAALAAGKALDAGDFKKSQFVEYEAFIGELQPALERDNELVYMSFNHPEALSLVQRFQEIDARRHFHENRSNEYGVADTNVWGILDPSYQELQKAAWAICREEELAVAKEVSVQEQTPRDYGRMVQRLRDRLGPYVDGHRDLTPYVRQNDERRPR